jgi:hypothetical protein
MKKRVGAVEEFTFEPLLVLGKQLHLTVAVTGWLSKEMPGKLQASCLRKCQVGYRLVV